MTTSVHIGLEQYLKWEWDKTEIHERVAVIGCGPAGLLAAWAAARCGYKVEILTDRKVPSTQMGAQYIHMMIPGVTTEDEAQWVQYTHVGTAHGYAEKIYGGTLGPAETSWSKFEGVVQCWPMQQIYQRLWEFFSDSIVEVPVDLKRLDNVAKNNHVVFSSMPLNVLLDPEAKLQDHFACETVYVYPRMITPWAGTSPHGPNTIVYNGWLAVQWYRQSRIFGQEWTEWPYSVGAEGVEEDLVRYGHEFNPLLLRQVVKPVVCTLPIHLSIPPNVRLIGRYGQWRKGALVHEAYVDVVNHLEHIRKHVSEISSASMTSPRTFE